MSRATLTKKGQIVIPAELRRRHRLVAGTQIELVEAGDHIELRVVRRTPRSDPEAGFGMVKVDASKKATKRLADFDAADFARS